MDSEYGDLAYELTDIQIESYFGSINRCEQFFSSMKLTKTNFRSQPTDTHLKQAQPTEKSTINTQCRY